MRELFNRALAEIEAAINENYLDYDDLNYVNGFNYAEVYEWCGWKYPDCGYDPLRDAAIDAAIRAARFIIYGR